MHPDTISRFVGKKIKLVTLDRMHYFATVLRVSDSDITITDKFGTTLVLALADVARLEEVVEK